MLTDDERKTLTDAAELLECDAAIDLFDETDAPAALAARLRAIAAPRLATVGELLAQDLTAVIEFASAASELRAVWQISTRTYSRSGSDMLVCRFWNVDAWEEWWAIGDWRFPTSNYRQPARLVPADRADADPVTRGPL